MHEYEVLIETINPCGGEAHANKEFKEINKKHIEYLDKQIKLLENMKNEESEEII